MTARVAGHLFETDHPDACCTCGISWSSIADTTRDMIGEHGVAHTAHLTSHEYEEIVTERNRRQELAARIWAAVAGVAAP